jgi:hypothetical protein
MRKSLLFAQYFVIAQVGLKHGRIYRQEHKVLLSFVEAIRDWNDLPGVGTMNESIRLK